MSFKSIDMQIAVHKQPDVSLIQRQLSEKPVLDQSAAASSQLKQDEVQRRRSPEASKAEEGTIRQSGEREKKESHGRFLSRAASDQENEQTETPHPYKGHRLDIKL
ncbi:hypothetical protein [Gorillibacterium sp. CAU 1737]|uniref:hypothetical protein n=1 Tax=Gorillibacterium sp. CAU 1737 TaxID=3140362 RepID=UPI0032606DCF